MQPDPECPSCALLSKQIAELIELVKELQQATEKQTGVIAKQAREIARLKSRVNPTSRNSSTPPSQDPFRHG